ncbi:MAG: hypothetical protein KY453_00025 [Gemmatimonadetes bacterium]|nr:hypothetical protein [Gemmatimonadota bacterium]
MTSFLDGGPIRTLAVSLIGAAAIAAGLVFIRQQKQTDTTQRLKQAPAGETVPASISLERLRELGY